LVLDGGDVGLVDGLPAVRGVDIETELASGFGGDNCGRLGSQVGGLRAWQLCLANSAAAAGPRDQCVSMARAAGPPARFAGPGIHRDGVRHLATRVVRVASLMA